MTNADQTSTELPLHKQVEHAVRDWIRSGRYTAGAQLPPAREISKLCDVNEQTVRRALKRLIDEGVLKGAQGKGVFVSQTGTKHQRVALVLPNLEDELTVQIARGAQEVLDPAGLHVLILDARRDSNKEDVNIVNLANLPIDGAIIFPISYGDISERILRLKMAEFPLVLVDKYFPGISVDCVLADDYAGSYALTSALIQRGYRRLAWLGGEEGSTTVEERLEGFRWALGDQGIPLARGQVRRLRLPTPTSDARVRVGEELDELLKLQPIAPGQALICANDLLALEAIRHLQRRGLRVPADIAVAGFDDSRAGAAAHPALTTVRKPIRQMGAQAAELLLRRLVQKGGAPERIVLPTEPVFRESSEAPAPA